MSANDGVDLGGLGVITTHMSLFVSEICPPGLQPAALETKVKPDDAISAMAIHAVTLVTFRSFIASKVQQSAAVGMTSPQEVSAGNGATRRARHAQDFQFAESGLRLRWTTVSSRLERGNGGD